MSSNKSETDGRMLAPPSAGVLRRRTSSVSLPNARVRIQSESDDVTSLLDNAGTNMFKERTELEISDYEYKREGKNPGLVLIFNQEHFEKHKFRLGSRRDVNELILCMSRLGFNINKKMVFNNLSVKETEDTIKQITSLDLSAVNSLIVFYLTHGSNLDRLEAADDYLKTEQIWKPFVECDTLKNKPKIFFFQACKGHDLNEVGGEQKVVNLIPNITFRTDYLHRDMFVGYSTTEGFLSFRDPSLGTWFIQELCKTFSSYGHRDDIVSLFIRATKRITRNYYEDGKEKEIFKQMPMFVSTLSKKYYLNRNKDRNIVLCVVKKQQRMEDQLDLMAEKVEGLLTKNN